MALLSYHTQRSCGQEGDAEPDQLCVPAPLFRKTEGNGTRHTCVSVLTSAFPLVYSAGLQVGLQTCNVVLQPEFVGLHPLALASNLGCLVCLVFLVLLVTNVLVMVPQPAFEGLQPEKTPSFDGFALSVLVTNLLAIAPQPAFDGLQPKREDLQL